jgi:hypothetical protein
MGESMNCKQGDLAIIVKCEICPEAIGSIVRCVEFKPGHSGRAAWVIDREVHSVKVVNGFKFSGGWFLDACLRPIRDNDGEDETLTWAGKPEKACV